MNRPATKLATKGMLDIRAMIPNGASSPIMLDMVAVIDSILISRVPVYANAIMIKAKTAMVIAMPDMRLTSSPTKYPATPPIISIIIIGAITSSIFLFHLLSL